MDTPGHLRAVVRRWGHRVGGRLATGRALGAPEWVILGVNNVCNLRCRMCDVGTGHADSNFAFHLTGATPRDMPLELCTQVIDQVAAAWPRTKVGFAFTEPSIWPHLVPALQHAQRRGVFTAVTTNGSRLPAVAAGLSAAGLGALSVSIDGPEDIHDAIRGQEGSFRRAVEGIRRLGHGIPVSVFACVTPWNVGHLERLLDALRPLPLAGVGLMHTNFTTDTLAAHHNALWGHRYPATASNVADLDVADIDLDALQAELTRIRGRAWPWPLTMSPELPDRAALEMFYRHPEVLVGRRCHDAWRAIMVKSDGTVIPAHGRCYRVEAGRVQETPLPVLWNAPALRQFRQALDASGGLLPACARCCSGFSP